MSKTYKLALRSPKNDRQVWVLRGVPDKDYGNRSSGAALGVDPRTETALWLVDNGEGTAKAEIAAVHRELYDLHQVRDIFKDGDRIVMPRTKVRQWHSYDPKEQSFYVPEVIFYADGFHILRQMPETRAQSVRNPRSVRTNPAKTRVLSAEQQSAQEEMEFEIGEVNKLADQYNKLFASAIKKHGYGPGGKWGGWLSGVGKEHWPSDVKTKLRRLLAERMERDKRVLAAYRRTGARKPFWKTPFIKQMRTCGSYGMGEDE